MGDGAGGVEEVEVYLSSTQSGIPQPADSDDTARPSQVGGIATLAARLAEAGAATAVLLAPESPAAVAGVLPIYVPAVTWRLHRDPFSLTTISPVEVEAQGQKFATDKAPHLVRKMTSAKRTEKGGTEIVISDASSEAPEATAELRMPFDAIQQDLRARVLAGNAITESVTESNAANTIAEAFLRGAGVTEETTWRTEHARLATGALLDWLTEKQRPLTPTRVAAVTVSKWPLPDASRTPTATPLNRNLVTSSKDFVRLHPYDGWTKSVYPSETFDSWSAEFRLAALMDTSPDVKIWTRTATDVPLRIGYTKGAGSHAYVPDFIVITADGIHWVVEAKADNKMGTEEVAVKTEAAAEWVRIVDSDSTVTQTWAYLLASETVIGAASSWSAVLAGGIVRR